MDMFLCNFIGLGAAYDCDQRPFDNSSDSVGATEEGDLPAGRRNNVRAINAGIGAGIGLLTAAPLALFSLFVCLAVARLIDMAGAIVRASDSEVMGRQLDTAVEPAAVEPAAVESAVVEPAVVEQAALWTATGFTAGFTAGVVAGTLARAAEVRERGARR